MTNLTLAVDEETLRKARIRAMQRGTSVNALVRDYLSRLAGESQAAEGIAEFRAAVAGAGAGSGPAGRAWTRDELHER
jgi:plasmid stability protein